VESSRSDYIKAHGEGDDEASDYMSIWRQNCEGDKTISIGPKNQADYMEAQIAKEIRQIFIGPENPVPTKTKCHIYRPHIQH
jgi:hypothetical protein